MNTYNVVINGTSYELPAYTMLIAEKLEKQEIINASTQKMRDKLKAMYELCEDLLGKQAVKELLGTFTEMDPNTLNIVYLEIIKQYNKPLTDYNTQQTAGKLEDVQIDKITELFKAVSQADMLTRVK